MFRVPRDARFRLTGGGGIPYPSFRSNVVAATDDELVATVEARPARVVVVDEAGVAVEGVEFEATGSTTVGDGKVWRWTDASGLVVFRGFRENVRLELLREGGAVSAYIVGGPRAPAGGWVSDRVFDASRQQWTLRRWLPRVGDEGADIETFAAANAEVRVVVRRLTALRARVVDRLGVPVEGAAAIASVDYGGGFVVPFGNSLTRDDGRVRCALSTEGRTFAADMTPASLSLEIWTPGVPTPTVVARPIVRLGVDCDFGDVVVPTAPRVKFRVVDPRGAPIKGAVIAARSDLRGDAPLSNPLGETDANGEAVLIEPLSEASFVVQTGLMRRVVSATDWARRLDGPGQTVEMPEVSTLAFVAGAAGVGAFCEARWTDAATGEPRSHRAEFSADGRAVLAGMVPATRVAVAFSDCNGGYAEADCVSPAAGEVAEVAVPPPPPNVLHVSVVDEDGAPVAGFGASLRAEDGSALLSVPPESGRTEWTAPCIGVRDGAVVVRVEVLRIATEARAALTPPLTRVVVRVAPRRAVRLEVRAQRTDDPAPDGVLVAVGPTHSLDRQGRTESGACEYWASAPESEPVLFRVAYAGEVRYVEAAVGMSAVELTLPAVGTVVAACARCPTFATLSVEAVPMAEGSEPVRDDSFFGPADSVWRSAPIGVRTGPCSVTAKLSFETPAGPRVVDLGVREARVAAGKETVVEF